MTQYVIIAKRNIWRGRKNHARSRIKENISRKEKGTFMSKVRRVYVEKKPAFAVKAKELQAEIKSYLGISSVTGVRELIRYDIENISEETNKKALVTVFSEPPVDTVFEETFELGNAKTFSVEYLPVFCRPDQVKEEFLRVMDIINIVFKSMNFENVEAQISLRDKVNREKYIGSDENWEKAEQAIIEACEEKGLTAKIEYGEAAFYGPKLDFMVKDAIGRRWQLGTIQVDYNLPERFQLEYMGSDNQKHRPVMIHRAPFGSMERFVAVLIEHTAGKFPLWLTPEQVVILPIADKFNDYAEQVKAELRKYDIRAIVDGRNEKIGRKIRDNEMKRIPYLLIVGEKEAANGEVSVRRQGEGDKGTMKIEEFGKNIAEEVSNMINKW